MEGIRRMVGRMNDLVRRSPNNEVQELRRRCGELNRKGRLAKIAPHADFKLLASLALHLPKDLLRVVVRSMDQLRLTNLYLDLDTSASAKRNIRNAAIPEVRRVLDRELASFEQRLEEADPLGFWQGVRARVVSLDKATS